MSVPEKHRATLHAWLDGAEVQIKAEYSDRWFDWYCTEIHQLSERDELRIKPKPKVKKWRWCLKETCAHYTEEEAKKEGFTQKIDGTEIEDDE